MTNQTKKEEVRKIIQKAVGEIMDLRHGCLIIFNIGRKRGGEVLPVDSGEADYIWIREEGTKDCYLISKRKIFRILGQPIQLHHVLRALQNVSIPYNELLAILPNGFLANYYAGGVGLEDIQSCMWDLSKDFDGQKQETYDFLYDLLKNDEKDT